VELGAISSFFVDLGLCPRPERSSDVGRGLEERKKNIEVVYDTLIFHD